MSNTHRRVQDDDNQTTQTIAKPAKQITVCLETQTTPSSSNQRNNGKAVELLQSQIKMATNSKRKTYRKTVLSY